MKRNRNENGLESSSGKMSIIFRQWSIVCLVLIFLLFACGSAGADNSTAVNATPASNSTTIVDNTTQIVVATTVIPATINLPVTTLPVSANSTTTIQTMVVTTIVTTSPASANATTSAPPSTNKSAMVATVAAAPIPVITASPFTPPPINAALEQAFVDRDIMRMRNITNADREAAAERAAAKGLVVANPATGGYGIASATNLTPYPGGTPDYWGPYPNYANSQLPVIDATGKAVPGTGIRKFVDSLPGLGPAGANNLGQYIPVAVNDATTYPGSDYYEIALVQYVEKMHSDLAPTTLRGYVQLETSVNTPTSKHIPLFYPNGSQIRNATGIPVLAYDNPHYLGPVVVAQRDVPVRVKFYNYLANGEDGNLFIPVDTTLMGAGIGPLGTNTSGLPFEYPQNRATLHLHGGNTPWISDGTPHQWTTPANENTPYPKGVSVRYVPDMDGGNEPPGVLTFYYTNQQSARLMWYHDHAIGITRLNVYVGEVAGYVLRDAQEQQMIASGAIPSDEIPLIIQDKTFTPSATQLAAQDPTWNWGANKSRAWPHTGDLWFPHVYMTNQNPWDIEGANAMGRWDYGPWFWPPFTGLLYGPVANPYASTYAPWEPPQIPGIPNPTIVPEAFMDTPMVNGAVYPYIELGPHAYRFRILNGCNDRYLNLQLYYAASNATMWSGTTLLNGSAGEVRMVPAIPNAGLPATWPTDGRDGGAPDPNATGPAWIQIGTEGGFLPAPVIVPSQPVTYEYNRRTITVLDVLNTSLYLGPAERADVIVDFTGIPSGTKLILYNDAPVPNPAFDSRYDYFTGDPDQVETGGAPTTVAGYGPNTRTIMQIQINGAIPATPGYVPGRIIGALPAAYKASQDPPLIPQAMYNNATTIVPPVGGYPADPYVRIQDTQTTFTPVNQSSPVTMDLQPKSIIEDWTLDYGRMNAMLGVEVPRTNVNIQTSIPYYYIDPPTEIFSNSVNGTQIGTLSDGTQIWKITHNGVDTHAVHFHMFNVQVINRVGWDGAVKPPYDYELGWKDTVKMRPLEDIIVAMRPITPNLPPAWGELPNSIRPLDPTTPLGSATTTIQYHNIDPTNLPAPVINHLVNYGWEYVWHCHLLGHEENDMMRAMSVAVAPNGTPSGLAAGKVTDIVTNTSAIFLAWTDNSVTETDWSVQRFNVTNNLWIDMVRVPSYTGPQTGGSAMAIVPIDNTTPDNLWRVMATNVVGDDTVYNPAVANGYPTVAVNSTPSANVTPTTGDPVPVGNPFTATPLTGNASLTVAFDSTSTTGATGWSWDFGDGDFTNATGMQNPIHTYQNNGAYNVTLTAMSIGGNTTVNQTGTPGYIIVGPSIPRSAPVANFTASPLNGTVPLTVKFTDLSVNATAWNWTFGDNWSYGNTSTSNSTLQNPTHTYIKAGLYNVTLNVTNSAGSNETTKIGFINGYVNVTNATSKVGVYRNGYWYLDSNGNGTWDGAYNDTVFYLGGTGNLSVVGDWSGNGKDKIGIFGGLGHWYLDFNGNGVWDGPPIDKAFYWGKIPGDIPVTGDWTGDGITKTGIFRPGGHWYLDMNNNGTWDGTPTDKTFFWGKQPGDIPVAGDWTGDGITKTGIFRAGGHWYLDMNNNGTWEGTPPDKEFFWGKQPGDIPVTGDWTGDGITKTGIFRPTVGFYLDLNNNGVYDGPPTDMFIPFGRLAGDKPVIGKW